MVESRQIFRPVPGLYTPSRRFPTADSLGYFLSPFGLKTGRKPIAEGRLSVSRIRANGLPSATPLASPSSMAARKAEGCASYGCSSRSNGLLHHRSYTDTRNDGRTHRRPHGLLNWRLAMAISKDLLEILVCPLCKATVELKPDQSGLKCVQCHRVYPCLLYT